MINEVSICIPSLKPDCKEQIKAINKCRYNIRHEVFSINKKQSAAKNRNECIDRASYDYIIMLDDDIEGFFDFWIDFMYLYYRCNYTNILSIRPIKKNGSLTTILGDNDGKLDSKTEVVKALHTDRTGLNLVGSACILFDRRDGVRFDEDYCSAVYEDTQFCMDYNKKYPEREILICNEVKLVHRNEMKRLEPDGVSKNKELFIKKNGDIL